jgi:hypothetical protein
MAMAYRSMAWAGHSGVRLEDVAETAEQTVIRRVETASSAKGRRPLSGTAGLFISSLTPSQGFVLSAFRQAKVRDEPFSELGTEVVAGVDSPRCAMDRRDLERHRAP